MKGIILANTGSPSSPNPDDIEAYLREYLMDERIRQLPKPLWKYLLHRHILPKRKHSSAKRYEFIWTEEGSPLVVNARILAEKVQALFDAEADAASSGETSLHPHLEHDEELGRSVTSSTPLRGDPSPSAQDDKPGSRTSKATAEGAWRSSAQDDKPGSRTGGGAASDARRPSPKDDKMGSRTGGTIASDARRPSDLDGETERRTGIPRETLVRSAMSYGSPSLVEVLSEMREAGVDQVVLLPLYPQSAYSPTMAVIDAFHRALERIGWQPDRRIINNYHDDPGYISAIVDSIKGVGYDPAAGDRLLLSLHAIPLKDEKAGDTYRAQIARSTELIAEGLGVDAADITVGYQSVFGHDKSKWTSPLSLDILESWREGDFRVVYACPGFSIDCLETLYDIPNEMVPALEGEGAKPLVERANGNVQAACNTSGRFIWVPTLNTSDTHARLIKDVIENAIASTIATLRLPR